MALAGAGKHAKEPQIVPTNIRDKFGKLSERIKQFTPKVFVRVRTLIYLGIYAAIGLAMLVHLSLRERLDVKVIADRNPQFVLLSDGSIRNGYELKILNMKGEAQQFLINISGLRDPLVAEASTNLTPRSWLATEVPADKAKSLKIFVTMPKGQIFQSSTPFAFTVSQMGSRDQKSVDATFEAPRK